MSGTVFFIWIFSSTKVSAVSFAIDTFIVGEKVEVTIGGMKEDRFYEACVIKEIVPNGYLVACGTAEYYVRPDWVRRPKAQPARPPKQDPGGLGPRIRVLAAPCRARVDGIDDSTPLRRGRLCIG